MENREEIWKDIAGFEGNYQVSNNGSVRSLDRIVDCGNSYKTLKGIILKESIKRGYNQVSLSKNVKRYYYNVHRLVALAFIPNPENKSQVNHIDGNKLNNRIENLEWNTCSENQLHALREGLHAMSRLILDTQTGIFYNSPLEASITYNINRGTLCNYLSGNAKNKTNLIYV